MSVAVLSREADNYFTQTPPKLGGVLRVSATTTSTGAALVDIAAAGTGLGSSIVGKYVEVWTSADMVWAVNNSGTGTIAAAGALGSTSGATLKAGERVRFIVPRGWSQFFAATASGTANIEIRQVSAQNREDFEAGI